MVENRATESTSATHPKLGGSKKSEARERPGGASGPEAGKQIPQNSKEGKKMKNIKTYEIQVKENGEFSPVKLVGKQNIFLNRQEAQGELEEYRHRFPHRITLRVCRIV